MVYETFQETITSKLRDRLGSGYRLMIQKIPKNNGLTLDGLSVSPRDQTVAPLIYLNQYYERFLDGLSIDTLVDEIMNICHENSDVLHVDFSMLNDFTQLKDKIVYRLINTRANRLLLEDIPSFPFQDLSIVFYLLLEKGAFGQMTALIHKRHLKLWNITAEQLYALADHNTPLLLPPELKSMVQVMEEITRAQLGDKYRDGLIDELLPDHENSPLYVLSNTTGINGACAVLYPGILKNFANALDQDLVILPSSIHEVLLVPYDDDVVFDDLSDMVTGINQHEVAVEDRLSNHVYFYSRAADEVVIAHDPASAYVS